MKPTHIAWDEVTHAMALHELAAYPKAFPELSHEAGLAGECIGRGWERDRTGKNGDLAFFFFFL